MQRALELDPRNVEAMVGVAILKMGSVDHQVRVLCNTSLLLLLVLLLLVQQLLLVLVQLVYASWCSSNSKAATTGCVA
jgi:hypothetical protein